MTYPGGNRRIDRVLADGFLDRLNEISLEELREMRTEAEQEETDLSYLRRLLQGRMDILRAELERRAGGTDAKSLIELLPGILADDGGQSAPRGMGRHATTEPSRADMHRRHVEALVADVDLSNPAGHDDASLAHVLGVLEHEEATVSTNRKAVQTVMDRCTAEIARRYKDGESSIADLLPTESS
jgi:anti-sigma-K factor RsiG